LHGYAVIPSKATTDASIGRRLFPIAATLRVLLSDIRVT
jgi:hypothetical protein